MDPVPIGAGGNSFKDIDSQKLFKELNLTNNSVFLDLACGYGDYSLAALDYMGQKGQIYAIDLWAEGIEALKDKINKNNIQRITPIIQDVSQTLPLQQDSIDICLIATVLHDFIEVNNAKQVLKQVKRVLKTGGKLAILEFKKEDSQEGPPNEIRLLPQDVENHLLPYSFRKIKYVDMGKRHYLMIFENNS